MKWARLSVFYLLALALALPPAASAQRRTLPAPICVLVSTQIVCYAAQGAVPRPVTPTSQRVVDFAIAADGEWLVYRTEEGTVRIASIYGAATTVIDTGALPPAARDHTLRTIDWSPDGLTIAYVTAAALRAAFPTASGEPAFVEATDRLYVNLLFSPGGARLAAQAHNGTWRFFTLQAETGVRHGLQSMGTFDRAADAAWLDDNSLIIAPEAGGLLRLNVAGAGEALHLTMAWEQSGGQFTRLVTTVDGQIRALQTEPGEVVGQPVSIAADGAARPLGSGKVDRRVEWVAQGRLMLYITSGTPILLEPETGLEQALPVQRASRVAWAAPPLLLAGSLSLDADVFYLAPDAMGVQQVWQMPGDGLNPVRQVTQLPQDAEEFAVSPDLRQIALRMGSALYAVPIPDDEVPTLTARGQGGATASEPPAIPTMPGSRLLARLDQTGAAQPDWRPDGRQVVYTAGDGVYLVDVPLPGDPAPAPVLFIAHPAEGRYARPRFSPDRRYLLVEYLSAAGNTAYQFNAIPLQTSVPGMVDAPFDGDNAFWGLNALFIVQPNGPGEWALVAKDSEADAVLARSAWPIVDVLALGGAPGAASQSALFLRNVGWPLGPVAIQLCATTGDPTQPEVRSAPIVLSAASLSPTGRFSAGLVRARDGRINTLVILDLHNGRKVAIRDADDVSALRWVR